MAKNQKSKNNTSLSLWTRMVFSSVATSLVLVLLLVMYYLDLPNTVGQATHWVALRLLGGIGYMSYLLPVILSYWAWQCYSASKQDKNNCISKALLLKITGGGLLIMLSGCILLGLPQINLSLPQQFYSGGWLGWGFGRLLEASLSYIGASIVSLGLFMLGIRFFTGVSWLTVMDITGKYTLKLFGFIKKQYRDIYAEFKKISALIKMHYAARSQKVITEKQEPTFNKQPPPLVSLKPPPPPTIIDTKVEIVKPSLRAVKEKQLELFEPTRSSQLPTLNLLDAPVKKVQQNFSNVTLENMSRDVESRLRDFGIEVQVVAVHPGPVITRFELQLAPGIKVSRITSLVKDLARSLSVISVRVVEVIPGKSFVGLELPNEQREIVNLREVLSSQQFDQARSPLSLALGKDISGHPVIVDITKMPHLLVAGTTGSGKSVALNVMLLSLLYKASANDVRLILIDPKMLELAVYEGIPHLLTPVVTDMKEAANALRWCVAEMERRYRLMASVGVRNLSGFNIKVKEAEKNGSPIVNPIIPPVPGAPVQYLQPLPYIVVIIDEFADMMMVVGKKVEQLIARIAQKARAAGIHMILATQRPSVDVITGLIKANVPTRIAFQVSSKIDSRTIIDQQGAEQLLGHGDMLYLPPGSGVPVRVHGAFVDDHEVHSVVNELKKQGEPQYLTEILESSTDTNPVLGIDEMNNSEDNSESDPLYDQAVQFVLETRRVSISNLQRRFKVGFNRAARMVDDMERAGLVSSMESNGNREILVPHTEN